MRPLLADLATSLQPIVEQLVCQAHLNHVLEMAKQPTWAQKQVSLLSDTKDPAEAVCQLTDQSRLSPATVINS